MTSKRHFRLPTQMTNVSGLVYNTLEGTVQFLKFFFFFFYLYVWKCPCFPLMVNPHCLSHSSCASHISCGNLNHEYMLFGARFITQNSFISTNLSRGITICIQWVLLWNSEFPSGLCAAVQQVINLLGLDQYIGYSPAIEKLLYRILSHAQIPCSIWQVFIFNLNCPFLANPIKTC